MAVGGQEAASGLFLSAGLNSCQANKQHTCWDPRTPQRYCPGCRWAGNVITKTGFFTLSPTLPPKHVHAVQVFLFTYAIYFYDTLQHFQSTFLCVI